MAALGAAYAMKGQDKMLINKLNLLVSKFASKTKSRYAITGVHIGPKGTTATDGYRLVRISLPKGRPENFPAVEGFEPAIEAEEMVLGLETLDKVGKAIPKSSNLPMLEHAQIGKVTNGKVKIAVTDLETSQVFGAKTLTDFPNADRVIDDLNAPKFAISLNAEHVRDMAAMVCSFSDTEMRIELFGPDKPVKVIARNGQTGQEMVGVIMPLKGNTEHVDNSFASVDGELTELVSC